ncbi:IPT/TIG domain-containing protein [Plantibacter flavus]|uniref:IPT/TIG domain-containing protein n=1 Tax=Plantibacter flavus TaxID=150123 RepID=UPI003F17D996
MAQIAHTPLVLKDYVLSLADNSYEKALSAVTFTPTAPTITWQGGTPDASFTDTGRATWVAGLTFAQDWDTVGSLSRYLFENEGAVVPVVFRPRNGTGPSFSATLVITPGAIGGAVNVVAEATVSLGLQGKPVLILGAAAVPTASSATPSTGPIAGGTLVKVVGSGFTGATAVAFGAINAPTFRVESDAVLYVLSPATAAGSKPIKVTNAVGPATVLAAYTYA